MKAMVKNTLAGVAALAMAGLMGLASANAAEQQWTFGDWQVMVSKVDTGEDYRITCTIQTVSNEIGTARALKVSLSNGDALPPDYFPGIVLEEVAGQPAGLQAGDNVVVEFDKGGSFLGVANASTDDAGQPVMAVWIDDGGKPDIMQAMRASNHALFRVNNVTAQVSSLKGFTASYLKMSEQCGFPASGVVD